MNAEQVKAVCSQKRNELLNKYFGKLIHEAAHEMPGKIDESRYSLELPSQVENEYYEFLEKLLAELYPDNSKKLSDILDKRHHAVACTTNDVKQMEAAYKDAKTITLWERITKTNHEDVTYYKGLLQAYTEDLLSWMETDFLEDVCK